MPRIEISHQAGFDVAESRGDELIQSTTKHINTQDLLNSDSSITIPLIPSPVNSDSHDLDVHTEHQSDAIDSATFDDEWGGFTDKRITLTLSEMIYLRMVLCGMRSLHSVSALRR